MPHLVRSATARATVAILLAATLLAASTVASKATLDHIPPFTLAFARFALALAVVLPACRVARVRPNLGPNSFALGLTGVVLPYVCQNLGLRFTTATNATLIIEGTVPVATILLGFALLRERVSAWHLVALLAAGSGIGAIVLQGAGGGSLAGGALATAAAVSFALATVLGRRVHADGASFAVLAGSVVVGAALLAPLAAVETAHQGLGPVTGTDAVLLLFLGLGGSALALLLTAYGLAHLGTAEVALLGTTMPVFGVALAALFLGEPLGLPQIAGSLLVLAGLLLTTRAPRASQRTRSAPRSALRPHWFIPHHAKPAPALAHAVVPYLETGQRGR